MRTREITICDQAWTLKYYKRAWAKDRVGECFPPPRREIRVLESGDRKAVRDTLFHELIHATEYEYQSIPHGLVADMAAALAEVL